MFNDIPKLKNQGESAYAICPFPAYFLIGSSGIQWSRSLFWVGLLLATLLAIAACGQQPVESGTLEGHVSIGPLAPALREGELPPTPSAEVYAARQIVIYEANGRSESTRLEIDAAGNYRVELPVGTYVVDINRIGIDSADGLPKEIEITANTTVRLDIDIDTGIR